MIPLPTISKRTNTLCPFTTLFRSAADLLDLHLRARAQHPRADPLGRRVHPHQPRRGDARARPTATKSEEHTSEIQSLMRISYAVFCLTIKKKQQQRDNLFIPSRTTQVWTTQQMRKQPKQHTR